MSCSTSDVRVASTPSMLSAASKPKCSSILRSICSQVSAIVASPSSHSIRNPIMRYLSHVNIRIFIAAQAQAGIHLVRRSRSPSLTCWPTACTQAKRRKKRGLIRRLHARVLDHLGPLGDLGPDVGVDLIGAAVLIG